MRGKQPHQVSVVQGMREQQLVRISLESGVSWGLRGRPLPPVARSGLPYKLWAQQLVRVA